MTDLGQGEAVVSWTPLGGTKRVCRFGVNCDIGRGPRNRILLADSAVSRQSGSWP